ncbi:MAG: bifunctional phosphoribosylaminoimidazolecarboxamide formyltransferase/IMP cyclohydrolase, partial [Candidatus Eisenbacteria bacterium]|nr:bifunctional phosphoribosylaminoimidazolecarboxamide formyltransferase/IMP cyclohydrolase [Candidatus Latescibacterota bacterium]MBD3301815.1 bifunctional phosphoribosylaminoimidazolecarboxamide formyltransferase/IMP cyclohydrolase [Candidatus Eisenbacteria bacterium]
MIRVRRALLSAYHKEGLEPLAEALVECGAEILSTGGTFAWLRERGFPVVSLEEWADLPALFGGRVKTLHPKVQGGILYRRGDPGDEKERERFGVEPIDLVAINLYPFTASIRSAPEDRARAIEMIDVGGPTMLRAAAKNHASVAVVCDPDDYRPVADALRQGSGALSESLCAKLAAKGFRLTAAYDAAIAGYLDAEDDVLPARFDRSEPLLWRLRYGENPSQQGAFYGPPEGFPGGLRKLQGKEISFNNLQDLEVAVELVRQLGPDPAAAVIKHATPCGAATAPMIVEAFRRARDGDALSAFGGIVALNRPVDRACAEELAQMFLEVIAAPEFPPEARETLGRKKNLRLLEGEELGRAATPPARTEKWFRNLGNGILLQDPMQHDLGESGWRVVTERVPTAEEEASLRFCWKVVRAVKSNAIACARDSRIIGIGGGQTSRIDALQLALMKARRGGHETVGAVMASD